MKRTCACFKYGSYWRIDAKHELQFRIKKFKKHYFWLLQQKKVMIKPIEFNTKRECDVLIRKFWDDFYNNNLIE